MRVLVVRLGAMGDVLHTLPAVSALGQAGAEVTWVVEPRWSVLLEGNRYVRERVLLNRRDWTSVKAAAAAVRRQGFDAAVDFQGLIKSGLVVGIARAGRKFGYARGQVREWPAALFYDVQVEARAAHIVDRHRELAAVVTGKGMGTVEFPVGEGKAEGRLPAGPFVLACPVAGWVSKEWPLARYGELAAALRKRWGMPLVLNGHAAVEGQLRAVPGVEVHVSSIAGLIDATRRAAAVVGVDSGPLHLAAALGKPGVAIFGPTDPARNGPYGGTMRVVRDGGAGTSYKRGATHDASMLAVSVERVMEEMEEVLG